MTAPDTPTRAPLHRLAGALLMVPSLAFAAGESPGRDQLASVLLLLTVVAGAYVLAHFVVDRLQSRFLLITGVEYVVLGAVLARTGVLDAGPQLAPVIAFAAGWVGLLIGTEQNLRRIQATRGWSMRVAVTDAVVTGAVILLGAWWALAQEMGFSHHEAWRVASVMACAAVASSTAGAELVGHRFAQVQGELLPALGRAARLSELLAIAGFGVVLAVFHESATDATVTLGPSDWVLVTLGLGVTLGLLFSAFLGEDRTENSRFLALVGIVSMATGAAFFLDLSGITVNLVLGLLLGNTARGRGLYQTLHGSRGPVVLVLLLFAGALWRPVPLVPGLLVTCGYLSARMFGKVFGSALASLGTPLRADLARGLVGQGEVALAIALSFRLVADGPVVDLAYTAILAGVLVYELAAPRLLKGLLVDAGALRQDMTLATATPDARTGAGSPAEGG